VRTGAGQSISRRNWGCRNIWWRPGQAPKINPAAEKVSATSSQFPALRNRFAGRSPGVQDVSCIHSAGACWFPVTKQRNTGHTNTSTRGDFQARLPNGRVFERTRHIFKKPILRCILFRRISSRRPFFGLQTRQIGLQIRKKDQKNKIANPANRITDSTNQPIINKIHIPALHGINAGMWFFLQII
jgi:hypothetical protein